MVDAPSQARPASSLNALSAAISAFQADPGLRTVSASTTEIYGDCPEPPEDAFVYYRGIDHKVGAITKFARLHPHGHS